MRILLVYPPFLDRRLDATDISALPMGLYSIGALLVEKGHQVQLLNLYDPGTPAETIDPCLTDFSPDVVGFSIVHANRWGGIDMAARVRRINPAIITVFGGIGATFLWRHLLTRFARIDYVITGEGEVAFNALLELLSSPNDPVPPPSSVLAAIRGLAFRNGGDIIHTGPPELVDDLDRLPDPAEYFTFQHVALTRGCPENCAFCGSPAFWGRRVRFHSTGYFVRRLRRLHEKGVSFFYFSDDTLTLKKERILAVCRAIISEKLPITWAAISRVDRVDAEILSLMRQAGCIQISYGIESGAETIRRRLNKRLSSGQIRQAFALTLSHGIMARAYLIYGSPGENDRTIQDSLDLIDTIKPLGLVCYLLTLFPGTALYHQYLLDSGLDDDIWLRRIEDLPYFETDPRLSRSEVLEYGRRLRTAFAERLPDYIRAVRLVDDDRLSACHADFYSRLALTLTHGDYADNPDIKDKTALARDLHETALSFHPDHRAFLGLGMLYQQSGEIDAAVDILTGGITHYPDSEELHLCLGTCYMNQGRFDRAGDCFRRFPGSARARAFLAACDRP